MPKHDDRHLTTTQLSAFIDKQLSQQELAACQSHLETCQQCQSALASLRQTVAFLQEMPQPALPRSFALPEGIRYLQELPERQSEEERQARANPPVRKRTGANNISRLLRVASAIAAVIGLAFLLSGIIPSLPHSQSAFTTSAPSTTLQQGSSQGQANHAPTSGSATVQKAVPADQHPTSVGTSTPSATPGNTNAALPPTRVKGSSTQNTPINSSNQPLATFPDLGTPLVRQGVGFILLVFGIVGLLLARRKPRRRENQR